MERGSVQIAPDFVTLDGGGMNERPSNQLAETLPAEVNLTSGTSLNYEISRSDEGGKIHVTPLKMEARSFINIPYLVP